MPLIRRRVEQQIEHNFAVQYHEITRYVHPTRLKAGDKPVPLSDISDRQLQDLAFLYPDEYLKPCRERGLRPAQPHVEEDETLAEVDETKPLPRRLVTRAAEQDEEEDGEEAAPEPASAEDIQEEVAPPESLASIKLDEAQEGFLTLNARNAVSFVQQNKDRRDFLSRLYVAERARTAGPRRTVLAAFTNVGIGDGDH